MLRYIAGTEPAIPSQQNIDECLELFYRINQELNDWEYRAGHANAGLPPDVVQAIRWMHGTPQFLPVSGLQIVPQTDEQRAELERFLDGQRKWRAEQPFYWIGPELGRSLTEVHEPYTPDFDTLG
jgi:hypothetical protein